MRNPDVCGPDSVMVARTIREAQQTRVELLRSIIDFARICLRRVEGAPEGAAARGLKRAWEGYELANRLLSKNRLGVANNESIREGLSALLRELKAAEARRQFGRRECTPRLA